MIRPVFRLWVSLLAILSGSLFMAGCSGGYLPPAADPDVARGALNDVLTSWRNEGDPTTLQKNTPPIYFNDPKLAPGVRLVDFEIEKGMETYGQSVRMTARLNLKSKDGSTKEKKFRYLVDTGPATVIVADGG